MALSRPLKTNFSAGEISPLMRARSDMEQYENAAATLLNVWVHKQGGVSKRSGTFMIQPTKDQAHRCRLRRWNVSNDASYVLEFTAGFVRFYRARGQVQNAGTAVQLATPYAYSDLQALSFAASLDVMYVFHPNYATRKISRTSSSTFTIATVAFVNGPYDAQNTGDVGAAGSSTASSADAGTAAAAPSGSGSGTGGDATGTTPAGGNAETPGGVG